MMQPRWCTVNLFLEFQIFHVAIPTPTSSLQRTLSHVTLDFTLALRTNTRSKLNGLSRRKERWRNFWLVLYTCLISFPWRTEEKGVKWQCAREATNEIRRKFFIPTPMASVCYGSQREKIPVSDTEGPCISFARISPPVRCIYTYVHTYIHTLYVYKLITIYCYYSFSRSFLFYILIHRSHWRKRNTNNTDFFYFHFLKR